MNHYQQTISTSLAMRQRTDVPPAIVEAYMRLQYGTLDHLDRITFDQETAIAIECFDADPDMSRKLAESYGLTS